MTTIGNITILIGALCCLGPTQLMAVDEGCPDLKGKDVAVHLQYLRGDRAKLAPPCIAGAIRLVGGKRYAEGLALLIRYLDYQDPDSLNRKDVGGSILYAYPAIDALSNFGKAIVPDLIAVIAHLDSAEVARHNAAETIDLIYGSRGPEAIAAVVGAAHGETDPAASNYLMDQARWLAARCVLERKNACENAVLK